MDYRIKRNVKFVLSLEKEAGALETQTLRRVIEEGLDEAYELYRLKKLRERMSGGSPEAVREISHLKQMVDPLEAKKARLELLRNRFRSALQPLTKEPGVKPIDPEEFTRVKLRQ